MTSKPLDLTRVVPTKDPAVRPSLSSGLEDVIDDETKSEDASPDNTRAAFKKVFGTATVD